MKKQTGLFTAAAFIIAVVLVAVQATYFSSPALDNVLSVKALADGGSLLATARDNKVEFYLLQENGEVKDSFSYTQRSGDKQYNLVDMSVGEHGYIFALRDVVDASTGEYREQELWLYRTGGFHLRRASTVSLTNEGDAPPVRYRWLSISSALILMGTGGENGGLHRTAYDLESLQGSGQRLVKNIREYPVEQSQGVYLAVPSGSESVYIAKSGRVFVSEESASSAKEIYPGRGGDEAHLLNYALFLAPDTSGSVYLGERESGDILRIGLQDGSTETVRGGSDVLVEARDYRMRDIAMMSMLDDKNFTAVVKNQATGNFELILCREGAHLYVPQVGGSALGGIGSILLRFAVFFIGAELLLMMGLGVFRIVSSSRTILLKLAFAAIPLLAVALTLFGIYSYQSYRAGVEENFQKQVEDEGNLLAALFGAETFNSIGFPLDYNNEDYQYLLGQMNTRSVHTDTAYYENDVLYTGVSAEQPCFYPFDITANRGKERLYRRAALTGRAQTGIVEDAIGERIACITPIGGSSGTTIFLLETSIFTANMEQYTGAYIRNYLIASLLFLGLFSALLLLACSRILRPIGKIKEGMEAFSKGERKVRLQTETNDELADISRVFNRMAGEIDVQLYNLKSLSDTYYRFIPQRVFQLLGKENLGDVDFGSVVEEERSVLCANLHLRQSTTDFEQIREMTNRFFGILNQVCGDRGATLLADSIDLRSMRILCPDTGTAVSVAMYAIANVDGYNASCPVGMRLDVSFFLHRACTSFGICGDERRYIPTLVCGELEYLARRCETFRQISSRLIVTSAAYEDLRAEEHFSRFIGYVDGPEGEMVGLYDFFDSCPSAMIRLLSETLTTFDKAMQLYQDKRYYDAKNLFTVVLRENQYDNVARHYIFQCEQKL
ncbi:MAG: HAMP domain-containing protein [Oscillospiraceae bacterium]